MSPLGCLIFKSITQAEMVYSACDTVEEGLLYVWSMRTKITEETLESDVAENIIVLCIGGFIYLQYNSLWFDTEIGSYTQLTS